ncbi:probable 3-hydroxyisobutyrate dehydrogenase-like 2, mitochondrial [Fagus crenata]
MLGHPPDVQQIVLGSDGLLSGLNPNSFIVDTTNNHPALARETFSAAGDIGASDGKLAILIGGDSGVVKWLTPLFDILGRVTYLGQAGCGQSCKIRNQIIVGGNLFECINLYNI